MVIVGMADTCICVHCVAGLLMKIIIQQEISILQTVKVGRDQADANCLDELEER